MPCRGVFRLLGGDEIFRLSSGGKSFPECIQWFCQAPLSSYGSASATDFHRLPFPNRQIYTNVLRPSNGRGEGCQFDPSSRRINGGDCLGKT